MPEPLYAIPGTVDLSHLLSELRRLRLENDLLREQLRLARIAKYGPSSEKLNDAQLLLLEQEPGVSRDEVIAEASREPLAEQPVEAKAVRESRKHPGRQSLPVDLPRVERMIAAKPEDCKCRACGAETKLIGYDESEQLDVEPARYFVLVSKREKRACTRCKDGGVAAALLPARIIDKSLVSDRIVIDTVVAKYSDHLPLYRQSVILKRETGVEISRGTMDGWVMRVGELLLPLVAAMKHQLVAGTYIQADETPVDVQVSNGNGTNHQAYLWQYGKPGGETVFDFRMGRGREGPKKFLDGYDGILQTDGYAAYERVGGAGMVHAACWAHARRKFVEALKLSPQDAAAARMVARADELFAVDAEARGLSPEARQVMRRERSVPLIDSLRGELRGLQRELLPAGALGRAVNYTLTLWPKLVKFLEHPELELSNNLAENSMRGVALGRKNWIHVGSEGAGPKVAAILSVVESCRRLGVPAREYLAELLPGLGDAKVRELSGRTPGAWAAARQKRG